MADSILITISGQLSIIQSKPCLECIACILSLILSTAPRRPAQSLGPLSISISSQVRTGDGHERSRTRPVCVGCRRARPSSAISRVQLSGTHHRTLFRSLPLTHPKFRLHIHFPFSPLWGPTKNTVKFTQNYQSSHTASLVEC